MSISVLNRSLGLCAKLSATELPPYLNHFSTLSSLGLSYVGNSQTAQKFEYCFSPEN